MRITHRWTGAATALMLAAAGLTGAAGDPARADTAAAAPTVTQVGASVVDSRGLYFVSYDGLVNSSSFQLNGITTYGGYQYAAYYDADRHAVVARRQLPAGDWQLAVLGHRLSIDDSHNVISLGISPADGRIHVGLDTHNTPIFYYRSEAGLAGSGGTWDASRFGGEQRTLGGVSLGNITYPQFVTTPEGRLQLSYRTGGSGDGTNELAEYDGGTWRTLGRWSASTGSYTQRGVTSTRRNMYLHGLTYGPDGRLHAAFTWREGNAGVMCNPGGLTNHDTGYVYSDDRGRTWRNNAGAVVGTTGGTAVSVSAPGLVVDPLNTDHGLINQESQAVDASGRPHVIISYVPGRFTQCVTAYAADRIRWARAFHVFSDATGWHKMEIPFALGSVGRSRIVFDKSDNAYVVLPYGKVVAASRATNWTDWRVLFDGAGLDAFGEVNVDYERLAVDGVLSVQYQQRSTGTTPSPVRVLDLRLG